ALKDSDKYIYYTNVSVSDEVLVDNQRYKKYIPFNENIVTKDTYTIYHQDGSKFYTLSEKAEYPIIIKEDNAYYVEFNNELVYILKEDVEEIKENQNTDLIPVSSIPVLNYHFIYDPKVTECNQRICMTTDLFTEHVKYLKSNYFDLTMKEFELFMNNKIRLPESVLVTLDDGWLSSNAIKILEENEFHATYFLITLGYKENKSEYVEFHSHTHNMHKVGVCPGGQGGGIKCLSEKVIQDDLKKSREALNNTTYFCYPFYETNSYAIEQLKKAGFTLAFVGGNRRAKPSDNHYLIPRYRITNSMTVDKLKKTIEK
ncbi:MAG: polysaccharide deacetylase family protein, partial [Bacilli bacterium]|nr:polysaccharide deacetylase family protein [Bacilli bacterium]